MSEHTAIGLVLLVVALNVAGALLLGRIFQVCSNELEEEPSWAVERQERKTTTARQRRKERA